MKARMSLVTAAFAVSYLAAAPSALADTEGACLRVLVPVAAGTMADAKMFETAPCGHDVDASAFRHDAALGFTRIVRALAPGEIVRAYPEFGLVMVKPGDILHVVVASGPVEIVREVQALQSARPGERLFVRAADGAVFAATFAPARP